MPTSRLFCYNDLDGLHTLTEQEILNLYFPHWSEQMKLRGKEELISEEHCLEDWIIVNWAWEIQQ